MKYYAVTEDPRELYHYGVKGMKWGQHLFGDDLRPKSNAYKKAASKLRSFANKYKENKIQKQQDKYAKALQKQQRNNDVIQKMYRYDRDYKRYNQNQQDMKRQAKLEKNYQKQESAIQKINDRNQMAEISRTISDAKLAGRYAKSERKMDKYLQQAREGKLKYGRLSSDQVQRVQERLQTEANARKLGSTEKTWKQQKKEARRKGKLQGIERGTAAIMEEVARAGAQFGIQGLKNRTLLNSQAKHEGKQERLKTRAKNKKTNREIKKDINNKVKQEAYEMAVREGAPFYARKHMGLKESAEMLKKIESDRAEEAFVKNLNNERRKRLVQETDNDYYNDKKFNRSLAEDRVRRIQQEDLDAHYNRIKEANNTRKDQEKLEKMAELAANYGYIPTSLGGKDVNKKENIEGLTRYYNLTKKGTNRMVEEAERRADEAEEAAKRAKQEAKKELEQEQRKREQEQIARENKRKQEQIDRAKKERQEYYRRAAENASDGLSAAYRNLKTIPKRTRKK